MKTMPLKDLLLIFGVSMMAHGICGMIRNGLGLYHMRKQTEYLYQFPPFSIFK